MLRDDADGSITQNIKIIKPHLTLFIYEKWVLRIKPHPNLFFYEKWVFNKWKILVSPFDVCVCS